MRVTLAAQVSKIHVLWWRIDSYNDSTFQVLSTSVANALGYYALEETVETEIFVRFFDKFFDCLNVRCLSASVRRRKPDLRPAVPESR